MLLTLKPQPWTIKQAASYFSTSEYLVKRAIKQKELKGILIKGILFQEETKYLMRQKRLCSQCMKMTNSLV